MDDQIRKLIGEKVSRLRTEAGYSSQRELADELGGLNPSFISAIETGRRGIPDQRLSDFAEALGVDERELRPESLGQRYSGGKVQSKEEVSDWQEMVFQDPDLEWGTKILLMALSIPPFMDQEEWICTVTEDSFVEKTGEAERSKRLVRENWTPMLNSGYVERIGEVKWVLRLVFPEG